MPAPLGTVQLVTRIAAVLVLVFGVYAARRGSPDGLSNIAPALLVGVAWPLLVLGSLSVRRLWRWVDPWDAMARVVEPLAGGPAPADGPDTDEMALLDETAVLDETAGPEHTSGPDEMPVADGAPDADHMSTLSVWPGVITAAAVVYFLVAQPGSTQPRTIGAALASYTIAMVALGVALGRRTLARTEIFGLTSRWAGQLRDGLAAGWAVPRGAEVVLGVLAGGLLFDLARRAPSYDELLRTGALSWASSGDPERDLRVGLAVACAAGGLVLYLAARWAARRGDRGTVAVAVLPVVLALLVVVKLRRFLVSVQLLRILVSDPLGRGKDYFGTSGASLDANPFGTGAQRGAAIVAVTLAGVIGAVAVRRRSRTSRDRDPAAYVLYLVVALATLGLTVAV